MPRSSAKALTDKGRSRSSAQISTSPVEKVKDIIPGRLTQDQWMEVLIQEDADETVADVMEELLSKVMEGCLKVYMKRELLPFSVSWAQDYLTQIVEQHISYLDEGEGSEELSKTEDSEPMPAPTEIWTPMCLPDENPIPRFASQKEVDSGRIPVEAAPEVNQKCKVVAKINKPAVQCEKRESPRMPLMERRYKVHIPRPPPKSDLKEKQQRNLAPKPVLSKLLPSLSCSGKKRDEGGYKNGRCSLSNHATGSLNQHKDYQSLPRLDPSCLPRHCISPQYEILDKNSTKSNAQKPSGRSKFEHIHKKQLTEGTVTDLRPPTSTKDQSGRPKTRNEADYSRKEWSPSQHSMDGMVSSGPLRLDKMEMAKGVSLRNPQAIDMNPFKVNSSHLSTKLRTIRRDKAVPLYSVEKVAAGLPQVTALFQSQS